MNDSNESIENSEPSKKKRGFPVVLTALTLLVVAFYFGAWRFQKELSDSIFHFDFAIVNFVVAGFGAMLWIGWVLWLLRSGHIAIISRVIPALIVLSGVGFLVCYKPVVTGGMSIARWEPRFWDSRKLADLNLTGSAETASVNENDFSQFLGNNRDGKIDGAIVQLTEPQDLKELWKVDIGKGWSGISTRGDYLFTMEQRGSSETVSCYEIATGKPVWATSVERRHDEAVGAVGPRATPTLDGEFVYTNGGNGIFQCLNIRNGEVVWRKDLCQILGIELKEGVTSRGHKYQLENTKVIWGRAASPLVVDDLVVIPGGGPSEGSQKTLLAFDKKTGDLIWQSGDTGISYSSPALLTLAGVRQIVSVNDKTVTSHNPKTGDVLWTHPWPGNSDGDANTSQPCKVSDSKVLLSKGYGVGAELIEVTQSGNGWSVNSLWKNSRVLKTKLTSSIVDGGNAFALSDTILECIDLETGKRQWKRGRFGHGQLLIVGDKLVVHHEDGSLHYIEKTADGYREIGEPLETVSGVGGIAWNYFAVTNRYVVVRNDLQMACFEIATNE